MRQAQSITVLAGGNTVVMGANSTVVADGDNTIATGANSTITFDGTYDICDELLHPIPQPPWVFSIHGESSIA